MIPAGQPWLFRTLAQCTRRHSCDGHHIQFPAPHLTFDLQVKGGCDMVADWIVIYAVLFVLAAAVVGRVPADT